MPGRPGQNRPQPAIEKAMKPAPVPSSIDATLDLLAQSNYLADRSLATVLFLALRMGRPIFLEGEAGVGKTEIAKVLSGTLGRRMIRLQCYEGLDVASAVYEWNYAAQMIAIRAAEAEGRQDREQIQSDVFSDRFLIKRPLLQALEPDPAGAPVLLIDELDRTDEPFEAYLLEVLSDFQVTIPELGTVKAAQTPIVIVTSNRTREIHDALKRRCFYHWVDYPDLKRELEILKVKAPGASERLSRQVVGFVQELRKLDLFKSPGVAESIDCFDVVVAENGAVLEFPQSRRHVVLGHRPQPSFLDALAACGVPYLAGESVVEADASWAGAILEVIRSLEQPLVLTFNRARVMVLPQAVGKSTGLRQALLALRLSIHNTIGIGDAENDHDLLDACEVGVAVGTRTESRGLLRGGSISTATMSIVSIFCSPSC